MRGIKYIFGKFDQQSMLSKVLKYLLSVLMVEGNIILGVDSKVIHVDFQLLFSQHICKDVVHEYLKCGRSIAEPEEHNSGFEQSHGGNKGSFPLVFLSDVDVVVFPANVKFGKQCGFCHIINEFWDEREFR